VSLFKYSILVLAVAGATLLAAALLVPAGTPVLTAVAFGAALATLNTLAAHALVRWSERRSTKLFLGAVLGGMVGRMALMLGAVLAGVLVLGLPRLPLVVSLLGYFVLFMIMELTLQHRSTGRAAGTR
jgi:branched-subunit amino acid ABC-type transport system permease component